MIKPKNKDEIKAEKFLHLVWKEVRFIFRNMINFLFFYKKPKDNFEKTFHLIEMIFIYVILQFAWIGMFGK